ncbi:hypothetical protein OKA05_10630 [Luteolibacter arcticus]|uniref:Uncharacterized protein n=1 Tax=Luteolibacter arcticus TaxID=1581411 RepID=A0ABT3GHL2_9BACT|nr:hypothetical protein [Luteolibacter arcticus]MCW1923008.1 hypothetical protein [Luteolibacter arcticus]
MTWWDPVAKELQKLEFKAHVFEVPVPPPPPLTPGMWLKRAWREHGWQVTGGVAGLVLVSLALHVFKARVTCFLKRLLPRRLPSLNP